MYRASVTCFERHVEQIVAILRTTWNSHAAPNTGTVRRLANLFSFVKEFSEVILLSLWETVGLAAHWRVRQKPEDHYSNVSVSTHGRHRLAQLRLHSAPDVK